MQYTPTLTLEILSGPLDGITLILTGETEWTRAGIGPLSFPWDAELGTPQAHVKPDAEGWTLTGVQSPHGTYRLNAEERITTETLRLTEGDIFKASDTWLLVHPACEQL